MPTRRGFLTLTAGASLAAGRAVGQDSPAPGRDAAATARKGDEAVQDHSERDEAARAGAIGMLRRKATVDLDRFGRYWRDVHGAVAARIPMFQGFQHHVGPVETGLWPELDAIEYRVPPDEAWEGVSDARFRSAEDQAAAGKGPAFGLLMEDEQNVFARTVLYPWGEGDALTHVDRIADGAPNGVDDLLRLLVLLRRRADIADAAFRGFVAGRFARALAASPDVLKVRRTLLRPYSGTYPPGAVNVAHDLAPDKEYQAMVEVVFADRAAARRLFASNDYRATEDDQRRHLGAIHVLPVRETYAYAYEGRPTLMGVRGAGAAELIEELGARNQAGPAVQRLLFGGTLP